VRLRIVMVGVAVAAAAAVGCSKQGAETSGSALPQPGSGQPGTSSEPPTSQTTTPGTPTKRPTTSPVSTKDGPCPYFTTEFAQDTVGQHLARSTVVTTHPYHGCVLYRPDGGKAVEVQVTIFLTAVAAQQRAVTVLGAGANPSPGVGDRATVLVQPDGTRLAASKGRYLIQIWINQQSSLQAHEIAVKVAARIR
jgi:hypothetical protein